MFLNQKSSFAYLMSVMLVFTMLLSGMGIAHAQDGKKRCQMTILFKQFSTLSHIVIISSISFLLLSLTVGVVFATVTPQVCDYYQKYGCTKVTYTTQGGGYLITERNFRGAIDGGADKWQIYWTKDWERINGSWVFREKWGPGGWQTNVNLSPWFGWSNDDRSRITNSLVSFKFRYYECISNQCYYWCSGIHEHYLWNNTSAEVGSGACTN